VFQCSTNAAFFHIQNINSNWMRFEETFVCYIDTTGSSGIYANVNILFLSFTVISVMTISLALNVIRGTVFHFQPYSYHVIFIAWRWINGITGILLHHYPLIKKHKANCCHHDTTSIKISGFCVSEHFIIVKKKLHCFTLSRA
jgi:hypothetical protein